MTAQHTPGPWKLSDFEVYPTVWKGAENTRNHALIARVSNWGGETNELREQAAANARLIAAAPELLNALCAIVASDDAHALTQQWIEMGRRAIAKATGEQP